MPVYPEAPRKEATYFSLHDISTLLDKMSDKEKAYSLRARSSIRMVDGKRERVYVFFLRNGSESVLEKLDNWWNAKAQYALAKQLACAALAESGMPAAYGQIRVRTLVQEKALLRIRKMDKMAPEKIQAILSACIAAQKEMQVFQDKLLSISSEDRLKFHEAHQILDSVLSKVKIIPAVFLSSQARLFIKDPINEFLAEAESHYADALLDAFMKFAKAAAYDRAMKEIDLPLALAFIDRWKTLTQASGQTDTANPVVREGERTAACRAAIDGLIDLCDRLPSAPSPTTQAVQCDERTAVVPAPSRPAAPGPVPQQYSASLPVLPAGLFQSLWACGAGRSAGAVHAASQALMPAARRMVRRAPLAAAPAAPARQPLRTAATILIRPAQSPQHISCDYQSELDMADIDREALILIANEGGLFSLSLACRQWLAELDRNQHAGEAHFSKVQYQAQTVLLARAERAPMHGCLDAAAIRRLGEVYDAAVQLAAAHNTPICLTDLFDYDPRTADQCVAAMLAPVRRCYREGLQPAIHIRVTSSRLRETIVAALKVLLSAQPAERPAVEVIDCLTEADRQLPGLIMVSRDSADPLNRALARRHAQHAAATAGAAAVSRVVPRKLLGSHARTHLYFLAQPCSLKNGLPDGARIAGEYAALFHEARQHRCKLVTLEVLSEMPAHEDLSIAALSAAIMAARAITPGLKVRIVTRNQRIRDGMQAAF
ncbi:hypothetical protein [Noviherbaspirillum soli]|uniref:hypothetical protein n=1 Tax=Noviherbaspirillum soli TaxID=1064518 RepID=UPI00188C0398|nr:hypothetical protein [Noviherbaspirillum soli]